MLKNKFKIIAILLTIILCVSAPFVFADDEISSEQTISDSEPEVTSEDTITDDETSDTSSDDSFKKSDVYLAGDNINIDYVVDGNVFIFADNVTISSQIGGDAFICAKTITISNQGYIFSNLFAVSDYLNIEGVVYDVYSCAKNVTVSGYVYRDLKSTSDTLNIFGTIGRNAFVSASTINFVNETSVVSEEEGSEPMTISSQGTISGNLNYSSKSEISIPENVVSGEINYTQISSSNENSSVKDYIVSLLTFLVLVAIIWLLSLWLAPKFLSNTDKLLTKRFLPVLGYGVLGLLLLPIIAILLICSGITSSIGLLILILYIALLCISTSVFLIAVNNVICNKFNISKKWPMFGILMIVSIVLWLLSLIPYIGVVLKIACVILGLGIVIVNILPHKEKSENKNENK